MDQRKEFIPPFLEQKCLWNCFDCNFILAGIPLSFDFEELEDFVVVSAFAVFSLFPFLLLCVLRDSYR